MSRIISTGRMWQLCFSEVQPNLKSGGITGHSWLLTLGLLGQSSPTWISSRLVIVAPSQKTPVSSILATSLNPGGSPPTRGHLGNEDPAPYQSRRPPISIELQS